jgi:hypothetical protein
VGRDLRMAASALGDGGGGGGERPGHRVTSALVFRLTFRKCGNPLIAMALTFLAMASSSIHFLARPHLFTLLFTVVFYTILERVRENRNARLLWWLPVLTVLWTNLHGGWFLGVVLIGLYGAGELAGGLFDGGTRSISGGGKAHAALCRDRGVVPGGQPGGALHVSPACAYLGVPDGFVPARAHSGDAAHQLPESGGALFRDSAAGGRRSVLLACYAASVSRSACCWCSSRTWP